MSRSDVNIVKGMEAIVNRDNIRAGLDMNDLKALEQRMVSGGLIQQKIKDPTDRFQDELGAAAKKLGINFTEYTKVKSKDVNLSKATIPYQSSQQTYQNTSLPKLTMDDIQPEFVPDVNSDSTEDSYERDSESEDAGGDTNDTDKPNTSYASSDVDYRSNYSNHSSHSSNNADLGSRTREQERRDHIETVMGGSANDANTDFSFEKEKREDMKCTMLAEIDSLVNTLSNYDVSLDRIPTVDRNSDYAEVETVLKMLRYKNDSARYCDFADEFLLFGAYALEDLFDGKRMWLNRYQPDLTGWHNNVNVKLKRMRHDTGQLVSGVMQDYNIGPGARILLELVPNLILYSKIKKQQHSQPGLFIDNNDDEMEQAKNRIRNINGD